jgi:O-antigen ligase
VHAAALASALVTLVLASAMLLVDPAPVAAVTGRSTAALDATTRFRTETWSEALSTWATRPALGLGPGQSAVQLAPARKADPSDDTNPNVLGSAQGLWSAALVDTGVVGFGLWVLFLGACVAAGWRLVRRHPTPVAVGLVAAATTGLLVSQVSGDRLELRVWVLAGLVLAAAAATGRDGTRDPGQRDK